MTDPYEDFFDYSKKEPSSNADREPFRPIEFTEEELSMSSKEPLDEVLESVDLFIQEAESFSKLLSETKAVEHRVVNSFARYFLVSKDHNDQESLQGEKDYHQLLWNKFEAIIGPMKALATIHLNTVKRFNRDIDKNYYSIEKLDREVKFEKSQVVDGINLQRQVLADAADDLETLAAALESTEARIKNYIDVGGANNISASEIAILSSNRTRMTTGRNHQFNYSFFKINSLDRTAIKMGVYLKGTTSQYLDKLMMAFDLK